MKTKLLITSILLVAAIGLAACGAVGSTPSSGEMRTVSVNGSGVIVLSPDMATVNVGVVTDSEDADQASAENAEKIDTIMETLIELGVAESNIKTVNFSVYPMQQYGERGEITNVVYRVENNLQVKVMDLEKLGEILDAVIKAGANSIYGVQFDLADREAVYAQAIEAAMQNADSRAVVLAEAADAVLGEIQSVNTYLGGGGMPFYYSEAAVDEAAIGGGAAPISPGEMEIRVEVTVVYAIS